MGPVSAPSSHDVPALESRGPHEASHARSATARGDTALARAQTASLDAHPARWAVALLFALYCTLQITHAWVVDDAYITLRTVDNFVHGLGLRWNPAERVQAYTHPLWLFVLSAGYAITRESFFTTLAISSAASLAAILVVLRSTSVRREHRAVLFLAVLLGSKSFLDYSTSGLENPLTHLLIALFFVRFFEPRGDPGSARRVGWLFLLCALAFVNRMDTLLMFAPACLYALYEERRELRAALKGALVALTPALAWVAFALFYYGTVVPNTAIAKLSGPRVRLTECLRAGVAYFADSAMNDPLTLVSCGLALYVAVGSRRPRTLAAGAGILLYLVYVLLAGAISTHMSMRFFSGTLFLSALVLAFEAAHWAQALGACAVTALWLAGSTVSPLRVGLDSYAQPKADRGHDLIIDTRAFVLNEGAALLNIVPYEPMPRHPWYRAGIEYRDNPEQVRVGGVFVSLAIGYSGFSAGPNHHYIDELGLSDPLMARLPLPRGGEFRPGHFFRTAPDGYLESIAQDRNLIVDPDLKQYYEAIRTITRAPLLSGARIATIFRFASGSYDRYLDAFARRNRLRSRRVR